MESMEVVLDLRITPACHKRYNWTVSNCPNTKNLSTGFYIQSGSVDLSMCGVDQTSQFGMTEYGKQ
jgi:hypothetical protein